MKFAKIAFVTYRTHPAITESDELVKTELEHRGHTVVGIPWDDSHTQWQQFDSVILRSCWDYHERATEFLNWIHILQEKHITLFNTPETVIWNATKTYLLDLEKKGFNIIPTILIEKHAPTTLEKVFNIHPWNTVVVKPVIGASSFGIFSVRKEEAKTKQWKLTELLRHSDCLVQPLMDEINNGELSLVFFGNQYSHTISKVPPRNEFRVNSSSGAHMSVISPSQDIILQATAIINNLPEVPLYSRVDGILVNNIFTLMELELIEPDLFFIFYPQAAQTMADAIEQRFI